MRKSGFFAGLHLGYIRLTHARSMSTQYPIIGDGRIKDLKAIRSDWSAVGRDIQKSARAYRTTV